MEYGKRVIALGFFDGVHIGHAALLRCAVNRAKELNVNAAVISFDTHPDKMISGTPVELINSPLDRAYIMRRLFGITDLIFLHFDRELRHMPWWKFIEWLKDDFGAVHLVAGYDFRFGHNGEGNSEKLLQRCKELGIGCDIINKVCLDDVPVSSTRIRGFLKSGKIEYANALLGHHHILTDFVRDGYRFGRTLGTPTINMRFENGVLVPRHGVYAAKTVILTTGETYEAVTNIGIRPTVSSGSNVTVESHLLGYSGNLYGQPICIEFCRFLRPEMQFSTIHELRDRIRMDAESTLTYFNKQTIDPFDFSNKEQQ